MGKTYCKTNGHFTKHLRANKLTYLEYYETYITGKKEICPYCVKSKQFYQKTDTYATTCGSPKCVGKQVSATKVNWPEESSIRQRLRIRGLVICR